MIEEIEDYFAKGCGRCERFDTPDCSTRQWEDGLARLRAICLDVGLVEAVKWGHPCYMHQDRNVAILGAHRGDFRISFFDAALLKDPDGVLEKQGPNTQHPNMIRFTSNSAVAGAESTLRSYLREGMGYVEAGVKPPKTEVDFELPLELVEALDADPELAEAFHSLTRGRQRSYVIHLSSAKKSATRVARIIRCREKIIAGKGALER